MLIRWVITQTVSPFSLAKGTIGDVVHVVTFLLAVIGFTLLYVIAPARPVKWRHGFIGGLLAAAAFELSRAVFAWYVANSPTYEILYGALAAVPIFMLWVFVFWMIVLAGAAVTASIAESE
jgi:membrane protein